MPDNSCLQCFQRPKSAHSPFCSRQCTDRAGSNAPKLIKIPVGHDLFEEVSRMFLEGWQGLVVPTVPYIKKIYLIVCENCIRRQYEGYRAEVEGYTDFVSSGVAPGNEQCKFRGLHRYCTLGEAGNTSFCPYPACGLCESIDGGFAPQLRSKQAGNGVSRLGSGLYTTANSFKADEYVGNYHEDSLHKAMMLCRVVLGRPYETTRDMSHITEPPEGFDSVYAVPGPCSSFQSDERVVYDHRAMIPAYLVVYDKW